MPPKSFPIQNPAVGKAKGAGRKSTREIVVGARKFKAMAEQALKRGTGKPAREVVKIQVDRRTTITCTPERVAYWMEKYPNAKVV